MIRLENWSLTQASPYLPPEFAMNCLRGKAYGHPRHADGEYIRSTVIIKAEGRIITTKSGSVYELGEIDPKYVEWLEEQGLPPVDSENPIKTIQSPEDSMMYKRGTILLN